jgi:hypothetical protein
VLAFRQANATLLMGAATEAMATLDDKLKRHQIRWIDVHNPPWTPAGQPVFTLSDKHQTSSVFESNLLSDDISKQAPP